MSTIQQKPAARAAQDEEVQLSIGRSEDRRVALATLAGTTIEWYDFFIYSNAAALVLAPLFFQPFTANATELAGRLISFATVGVSFVFRPLGAIVAGHLGDRVGRKAMLVATLLIMGLATFGIGLLPDYASIGMAAPIMLIVLRVLQGISAGGEWGGAALMAVEHAPRKQRGLFGGFPQMGVPIGMLLATLVLAAARGATTPEQFLAWGWRIPFLVSFLLVIAGLVIRLGVAESPVFKEISAAKGQVKLPLLDMLRFAPGGLIKSSLIFTGHSVAGYMITGGYILSYATTDLKMDASQMLWVVALSAFVYIFTTLLGGWLSDRIGRTLTMKIGFAILIAWYFPMFWFVDMATLTGVATGMVVLTFGLGLTYGPLSALYAEMFPARVRYTGAALGYAIGSILGGAFSPMIATWLTATFGSVSAVATYLLLVSFVGLITMFFVKDVTGEDLSIGSGKIPGEAKLEAALSQRGLVPSDK
jgi:MFS family permease